MSYNFDITIIGGGVVGLAVASNISCKEKETCVVEKHESFGQETSSRNSEVIHSGIYYPQNTLKAKLCIEGKFMLYELCEKYKIPYKRIGKFIVACDNDEIKELEILGDNGRKNGVDDLKMLTKKELNRFEPNVRGESALISPSTGIIDSHKLMKYYEQKAKENGTIITYNSEVIGISKKADGYEVTIKEPSGDKVSFKTKILINCAGLNSDKIAELAGIDIIKADYKIHFCKGEYFGVRSRPDTVVNSLIYPVPHLKSGGLGVHATIDLQGSIRLGPNAHYVENIDYTVDIAHKKTFYDSAKKLLPALKYEDVEPGMVGVRPKLQKFGGDFRDFVIQDESDKGFPGLINLIGIESPGLTASPAIGKYVAKIVSKILN